MVGQNENFPPPLLVLFWTRDPVWIKIRTRDKHTGSETLISFLAQDLWWPGGGGGHGQQAGAGTAQPGRQSAGRGRGQAGQTAHARPRPPGHPPAHGGQRGAGRGRGGSRTRRRGRRGRRQGRVCNKKPTQKNPLKMFFWGFFNFYFFYENNTNFSL